VESIGTASVKVTAGVVPTSSLRADFTLQLGENARDCGLREAKFAGGAREAAGMRGPDERSQSYESISHLLGE
jgi:hypothetical protein